MNATEDADALPTPDPHESPRLGDISPVQWKSGIAACLGWLFDGLDMHLYTLVALPFVAELMRLEQKDPLVGEYSSIIQAAFLVGWALGGGFFGRVGDRLGRSHALVLTILTYAIFTGLSFFAQTWWQLLILRFLAALGIGGEWAVGASLLSETLPRRWQPWIAAVLQSSVNVGIMLAGVAGILLAIAGLPNRAVFLVGVAPAFLVLWIRRAVPEPEEWQAATSAEDASRVGIANLFEPAIRRTTILVILVCAFSLTAHWAFMFWYAQHLRGLESLALLAESQRTRFVSETLSLLMIASIVGNFLAAWVARWIGYRRTLVGGFLFYFAAMCVTYAVPRDHEALWRLLPVLGVASGTFAIFTMYLPPLFPTLLRTTGAGFCYNIGRIASAAGTVGFGLLAPVNDHRYALLYAGLLFLPAAIVALLLPDSPHESAWLRPRWLPKEEAPLRVS